MVLSASSPPRKVARRKTVKKRVNVVIEAAPFDRPQPASPPRPYLFTVADFYRMGENGILKPHERVELIEGEIVMMPPIDPGHAEGTHQSQRKFILQSKGDFDVRCQQPVRLGPISEPVPDLSVVRPKSYKSQHPTPEDILLIVEVANTSLQEDLGRKRRLYAIAKIPEYWVLDVQSNELHVFTKPRRGDYAEHRVLAADETVQSSTLPKIVAKVSELLP